MWGRDKIGTGDQGEWTRLLRSRCWRQEEERQKQAFFKLSAGKSSEMMKPSAINIWNTCCARHPDRLDHKSNYE